jgi:UDP-3-O-[3-hydroxymyristoyl] glucosamine N-acyltransferase
MFNPFFKNRGPFLILDILNFLETKTLSVATNVEIKNIKDLHNANNSEITFFHSKKYKKLAQKTKASFCITTESLKNELPIFMCSFNC